jgi:hypothetical protein
MDAIGWMRRYIYVGQSSIAMQANHALPWCENTISPTRIDNHHRLSLLKNPVKCCCNPRLDVHTTRTGPTTGSTTDIYFEKNIRQLARTELAAGGSVWSVRQSDPTPGCSDRIVPDQVPASAPGPTSLLTSSRSDSWTV